LQAFGEDFVACKLRHLGISSLVAIVIPAKAGTQGNLPYPRPRTPASAGATVTLNHTFFPQCFEVAGAHAKPVPEDLRIVLPQERCRLQLWRAPVEAHGPCRHLERPSRMF